jgi:hypothetical protein
MPSSFAAADPVAELRGERGMDAEDADAPLEALLALVREFLPHMLEQLDGLS